MISFILYYQSITAKGISLINTDTNSFSIKIVQSNQPQLQIYLANSSPQLFNLGQSGSRHTIAFKVTGFKIQSQVTYYVDSNQVGSFTLANTLNPFSFIYLGSQQQQPNDNFQIQDLYLIPNSDFKLNFPADPTVVPQNCNYFFYFNLNFTYCLSCQANYQLNYFGQCDPTSQQAQIQQIQFSYSYSGNNFISILDSTQSSSFAYNYQASNNQFDFLILGYYQITQWQQNQLFTSLAYLQADQVNQYYFLNLYLESLTKLTLKLTLDADNLICYQSINFSNSILNQWVFLGFGFKASSLQAYLVFQDNDRISQYLKFTCQHSQNGVQFNSFQICLGCLITNSNLYSQFVGKIKNVKLIEAFNDYTNINQYIYFDQDLMEQSASNINYINIYNLKDLYTYSMPGFSFVCQNGYYFIEGICVAQCSNVIRSSTALGFYNPLFTNYATSSCEICSQNCLVCSSFQTCTSCRAGFVVDQQSQQCVSCTQGTFYDNASQTCVQTCTSITDLMNQQCVTQQDAAVLNSLNFFVSQLLTYNEGFQIINSNGISQQDTFTKCQGNSPYSFFMFYGGESVSSTYQIQKTWSDLPNNYSKDIQFNVVLFNFNSLDDLQVQINGQIITYIQALLISQNQNICVSSNQQQIQAIYQLSYKIISNANTVQLVIKYRQNGFGIRNIQLSVNKCHSSCNSCENGPKPWNCITCQRKNNLTSTQQCICAIDEYYQSNQCYSSPCYNCVKCSIQNCLRCEDETGLCLICSSGYSLLQGQCVANCSQQQLYSSYTINSSTTYCYLANKLAFDHFQTGKIIRNLEYWQLSVDYISQNGFLLGCILNKLLPNLGNVNGVQDYITLQMFVSQFQSKFRGILFDINLVIIDNLTLNQDYIVFTFAGTEVNRVTYQGQPTTYSTCVNHSYSEFIAEVLLPIYKGDGQINLQIQSLFNDAKSNKSFALGEVKAYFIVNEPLCIKYSFGLNYSSSQCQSCNTNSSLGLNNQCICNDGYFFYYKQDQLDAVCIQCNPACSKCVGPSVYDCLGCSANFYYQVATKSCVNQCQSNEFLFQNTECRQCDNSCLTCQGPNQTDCFTCSNNYLLDIQSHLCVSQCQSNQKQSKNPSNGQILCVICDQTCLTCLGPYKTDCITCSNNYYLDSSSNLCVQQCQSNQYQSLNANTGQIICLPCNQACQTCQGPNNTDCLICINNYYLDYVSNLCVPQCSSNQYQNTPSSQFCSAIFDSNSLILIGPNSTCFISGSQILVNLENNSTLMQNDNLNFNRNVLSFQGQNMFITNFYKTSVSQINKGKSETIFSYSSVQNICSNIVISFKQFVNDAQRGLLSLNWSVVSFSSIPTEQNLKTINQILQNANQSKQTSLTITKQLVPIDSILTLQLFQIFKVNQNKTQTFQIYYTDKSIYVEYKQSQQPPYYRQMGISYSFTFLTLICSNNVSSFQLLPTNIQITPSSQISYLKNSYNNYQGHNLEVDILQYTLPSNQISSFNVTFSLYKNTNITNSVSVVINQVEKEKKDNEILVSELDDSPYYPDEIANNKIKINRLQNLKTNQIQKENKESQIQVSELDYSPYYPNEIANSKIIINRLQSLKTRSILIQEKTPSINKKIDKTENLTEIQITRGDSNPFGNQVTNKDIQQQVTDSLQTYPSFEKGSTTNKKQNQIKSGENKSSNQQINKDLIVFDNKESKSNQKVESIIENIIKKADSIISATNKIESKIQEDQYNTLNTEQSDENNIELNQKNKIQLQNEAVEKNSKNKEENIIKKQETYKLVQQLSFLIRIFIFHNFFSIFLIYNQDLSRPYRFLQIYLNVIHTLALSILFYDCRFFYQYFLNSLLNVIIIESVLFFLEYLYKKKGFLQMISITLKIIILSVYYYIIAYNILDQNPTEANLFVELFLIATGTNFVVLQCVGILLKNLIIALYFKWTESNTFICWIYRILHLQDIFDCI
ncbi:hypothetical protein ABPG73_006258 [Tetrahymena malaccensis]